ncbi:hypothetical protein CDD81_881 [Ophiocordyceps australis]|uniref:Uncharacterized protein n=1 Tax=Ophiocordyceps australis TaxID=1399860 RepID=A0A2C5YEA0_9HYPO|nr:hypothetical protein CDD81_881 [Ophiocordyceps australis]
MKQGQSCHVGGHLDASAALAPFGSAAGALHDAFGPMRSPRHAWCHGLANSASAQVTSPSLHDPEGAGHSQRRHLLFRAVPSSPTASGGLDRQIAVILGANPFLWATRCLPNSDDGLQQPHANRTPSTCVPTPVFVRPQMSTSRHFEAFHLLLATFPEALAPVFDCLLTEPPYAFISISNVSLGINFPPTRLVVQIMTQQWPLRLECRLQSRNFFFMRQVNSLGPARDL